MRNRWSTSRTEAFSDGVFAIAITLLVLDLKLPAELVAQLAVDPNTHQVHFSEMWAGILDEWPAYLGYVTSFLTIGGIWLTHHGIFSRLRFVNRQMMRLNLLLLMAVSFLPFPTRLVTEAVRHTDAESAAVIFYGLTLFVISILLGGLWGAVERKPELLEPDVTKEDASSILVATVPNIGFYAAFILLAFPAPRVAAVGYLLIAIFLVLRARGDESESEPDALEEAI